MAVDICSEDRSPSTAPPFSFSHHPHHPDDDVSSPINPLNPDADFSFWDGNFCTINEPSSADELFSDGLIRPLYFQQQTSQAYKHVRISKHKSLASYHPPHLPLPPKQDSLKETETETETEPEPRPQSKSFWRIKRSTSLHCQTSHKKSTIWSLPLLSRSNSTGSVPSPKPPPSSLPSKDCTKQNSLKQPRNSTGKSSSSNVYAYPLSRKPPLGKHYAGSYGNGGWISPVLNLPPPCISKGTSGFLGLNSLFGNGKDHKSNRK